MPSPRSKTGELHVLERGVVGVGLRRAGPAHERDLVVADLEPGDVRVAERAAAGVVIVWDCEEGRMPHWCGILGDDPSAIEEDRRKFYVSLTRARRRVHLVWSAWRVSSAASSAT